MLYKYKTKYFKVTHKKQKHGEESKNQPLLLAGPRMVASIAVTISFQEIPEAFLQSCSRWELQL